MQKSLLLKMTLLVPVLVLAVGCASYAQRVEAEAEAIKLDRPDRPVKHVLTGELLYQLLAGEFAGNRGDMATAAGYYLTASRLTIDPKVAARAAYIALFAERYDDALIAIKRWETLSPEHPTDISRTRRHLGVAGKTRRG